jgi:GTP-binding protein
VMEEERDERAQAVIARLGWTQPWFVIAAISKEGTWPICQQVMRYLEALRAPPEEDFSESDEPA